MGNSILGKRSRNFYRGFNQRQINYLKNKFESISENGKLKKQRFIQSYKAQDIFFDNFIAEADFEQSGGVQEYEFICMISFLCNLSVQQIGGRLFKILTNNKKDKITQKQLLPFTKMCLKYNNYLVNKEIDQKEIQKINKNKFLKYDNDKSKFIDQKQFTSICLKDQDYKNWLFNMGFITKNQMQFQDQIYDLVDSDIGQQVQRQLRDLNPNVDRIKRGIQNRQKDDQFKAPQVIQTICKKPWMCSIDIGFVKSEIKPQQQSPSQTLQLNYVFGYRSFDCRNNLKFDNKDRVVYHQAALGIVMDTNKQNNENQSNQIYLKQHKDDITCLDIKGNDVITGQAGTIPMIVIWNTQSQQKNLKSSFTITKGLTNSVGTVCWSPSQNLIAASCNDNDHSLVVYNLKQLKQLQNNLTSTKTGLICSGALTKSVVFDIRFQLDQKGLAVATVKQILFVTFQNGVINSSRGDFGQFSATMALCLQPIKAKIKDKNIDVIVAGMGNGSIYFWQKGKVIKSLVGHSGSVSCICSQNDNKTFITGDKSGKILFWNDKYEKSRQINVPKTNSLSNMIVSLCLGKKKQLLIGTKGSNIYLLNNNDGMESAKLLMSGHDEGNINAVTIFKDFIITGGEDQRLIKWQYKNNKKMVTDTKCQYSIRCLASCQSKDIIFVGYKNGIIHAYNSDLKKYDNLLYSKVKNPDQEALNNIRFSWAQDWIAVSYLIPKPRIVIFTYDRKNMSDLKIIGELNMPFPVISFDIARKQKAPHYISCNLRNNTQEIYKIYQFSFKNEKVSDQRELTVQQIRKSLMRQKQTHIQWLTHTCPYTPLTGAIVSEGTQQKDITVVARNKFGQNVLLVGDRFSKLKLFTYPCPMNKVFNKYEGHSNAVTAVQFCNKECIVTIGGQQKTIFIWKYDPKQVLNQYTYQQIQQRPKRQADQGVQAGAVLPFKGNIKAPTNFKPNPKKDNIIPQQNIKIHHVFGIRNSYINDQVRNQCKFTSDGSSILFPTACMAVKMNIQTKNQEIYLEHKQDIVSFAVDKDKKLMATGQMAQKNEANPLKKILSIYVWDIQTKKVLKKLDGFHTIAVVLLQFSPSGKLLFTCGNDDKNTYAAYDWRAGTILYSGPVSRAKVNSIFWKNQTQFATCGLDHFKVWQSGKGMIGQFKGKSQALFSVVGSGNYYLTGGGSGDIHIWTGNSYVRKIPGAHKGRVQCLVLRQSFIYSGGDDGNILRWKKKGSGQIENNQKIADSRDAFESKDKQQQYGILGIDFTMQKSDDNFLFVTRGCAAIVKKKDKYKIITQGHYDGQLWGLATRVRQNDCFVTTGDDQSIRMWSIQKKQLITRTNLQSDSKKINKIRAVDWTPDGQRIIVADNKCKLYIFDKNLKQKGQPYVGTIAKYNEDTKDPFVQELKVSPNGEFVAFGSHGKAEYIQFVKLQKDGFGKSNSIKGTQSALLHLDWSKDSQYVCINTQAYELNIYNREQKNGIPQSATAHKDTQWATWTQKLGFPVQGIFLKPQLFSINTVCRDPEGKFIAVGYDDQTIRLFRYPCYIPKMINKTYYGHSSHLTRVRFTNKYMISTGGLDRTIIVWEVQRPYQKEEMIENEQDESYYENFDEQVDLPRSQLAKVRNKKIKKVKQLEFTEVQDEGDQFLAVKPWLGAIKQPTDQYPKQTQQAPKSTLTLQYVHGYRVKDCRQNLYFGQNGKIIYHAAAVLIYHDIKSNKQHLFTDHNDDILSIDYHRKSQGVITGELGPKPIVNYYKNQQSQPLVFKAPVTKGIMSVAISPSGKRAVVVGMDDDHMIAVLDLVKGGVIAKQKGGKKVVLKLCWVDDNEFVSIGIRHYKYWVLDGSKLKGKDGSNPGNFVSLGISNKLIYVGASGGVINLYKGSSIAKSVTLLKPKQTISKQLIQVLQESACIASVVQSIFVTQEFVIAGTKDGYIFVLNKDLQTKNCLYLTNLLSQFKLTSQNTSIRSIDCVDNRLLIGTFGAQIYEIKLKNINDSKIQDVKCHAKCHYSPNNSWTNQVWGLHVAQDIAYSCSDDATVRIWNTSTNKLLSIASLNQIQIKQQKTKQISFIKKQKDPKTNDFYDSSKGRSISVSPDGKYVIVGCKDGSVYFFTLDQKYNMKLIQIQKIAEQWISQIKFGFNLLIIGSHDNAIYVYDYDPDQNQPSKAFKRKYRPMKKHSSYITHCDISRDSCYLQSTCGAYQLLFWDLSTGKQITSGATMLRNERWASWTCNLGWPVQGIYPKCTDGTFIHSVDRSHQNKNNKMYVDDPKTPYILAAGNNNGQICLYNFPCTIKNSKYVSGKGHSSHVTNVRWTTNDEKIVSVGGEDQCVMIWKVKK